MNKPIPNINELPSSYANRMGQFYSEFVSPKDKKKKGQFFTPKAIANLMASFCEHSNVNIRVLDPGCGVFILSCSVIEYLISKNSNIRSLELVGYETDSELIPFSESVVQYLNEWLENKKIQFKYSIIQNDFILENYEYTRENPSFYAPKDELYDIIISNPPFFKLPKDDIRVKAVKESLNNQPNIYSIFMSVAACLLNNEGELIFIIPRSFSSGNYFKTFREFFFKKIKVKRIHLFVSRKEAFQKDSVLQELLILKGINGRNTKNNNEITISSSNGIGDIENIEIKKYDISELIDFNSKEMMLHLPINNTEVTIHRLFKNWNGNLNKYNIQISTGPVVSFRTREFIKDGNSNSEGDLAPLIWLHNVEKMQFNWPIYRPNKGQFIIVQKETKSSLVKNKNYILLRRFSSKDDKSRLIAAPYFCNIIDSDVIGLENKLNYIYRPKGLLSRSEILGLCALFNSSLFDIQFRSFNGNVNVSATELREMSLPPLEQIEEIGEKIIFSNDFSIKNINQIINNYFNTFELLNYYEEN